MVRFFITSQCTYMNKGRNNKEIYFNYIKMFHLISKLFIIISYLYNFIYKNAKNCNNFNILQWVLSVDLCIEMKIKIQENVFITNYYSVSYIKLEK